MSSPFVTDDNYDNDDDGDEDDDDKACPEHTALIDRTINCIFRRRSVVKRQTGSAVFAVFELVVFCLPSSSVSVCVPFRQLFKSSAPASAKTKSMQTARGVRHVRVDGSGRSGGGSGGRSERDMMMMAMGAGVSARITHAAH